VGEIRRVLNSFLLFLEEDQSESIIVAATNHPKLLDRALFRRFEAVIEFRLPSKDVTEKVLRSRLAMLDTTGLEWPKVVHAATGLSHADIARACEHAAKEAILAHRTRVETKELLRALSERRAAHKPAHG
jgi:AAA+ superfamily predicted ATPase